MLEQGLPTGEMDRDDRDDENNTELELSVEVQEPENEQIDEKDEQSITAVQKEAIEMMENLASLQVVKQKLFCDECRDDSTCGPEEWEVNHRDLSHLTHHRKSYHSPTACYQHFLEQCKALNPADCNHFRCPWPAQCEPEEAVDNNNNSTDLDETSRLSLKSWRSKITLIEHILEEHFDGELTQDMRTCFEAVRDDHQKQLEARETQVNRDEDSVDEQQLDDTENDLGVCPECRVDPSLPSDRRIVRMATLSHIKKHLKARIHHADARAIRMLIKDGGGKISVQSATCPYCHHFHRTLYNVCVHIMHIGHALIPHNVLPIYEALVDSLHDSTRDSMTEEQR
ncbi:hypothetical protein K438DRAFT_1880802 [Mycena galopus ATCC 62051]|nr:hypothetical protein K438DRAFT_1880802 [Mycena galopus ATCC 62051]